MYKKICLFLIIWIGLVNYIFCQENNYQPPTYKTGEADFVSFAKEHIIYPDTLLETKVAANIFINKSGKVLYTAAISPISAFNKAVKDGLKNMPDWNPGFKNNLAIDTFFTQTFFFSLGGAKYNHNTNIVEIVRELPLYDFVHNQEWKNIFKKICRNYYDSLQHRYFEPEIKDTVVIVKAMDSEKNVSAVLQYNILSTGTIDIASGIATYYYDVNQKRKEFPFQHFKIHGLYKSWFAKGQLEDIKLFHNDMLHGEQLTYYNNGQLKTRGLWKYGKLDSSIEEYTKTGEKTDLSKIDDQNNLLKDHTVFTIVEKQPVFPGGERGLKKFLVENIIYPQEAKDKGIMGTVYVQFIVDIDGSVKNPKILKGVHPCLDEEALRVIKKMPKWKPAILRGKSVRIYFNLPIKFTLHDKN